MNARPISRSLTNSLWTYRYTVAVVVIFVIAGLVRLLYLGSLPSNFHEDEVLVGYVGRYILDHGKDLYGNPWPIWYFDKFGDYYIIGPFYLSGLSTLIFGLNEFAVRFPAAFLGSCTVLALYGLTYELTRSRGVALCSAMALAILPWHTVSSRSSGEGVIGSFFAILGLYLILRGIRTGGYVPILLGIFQLLLTYWIYHPFRIYTPVFLCFIVVTYWGRIQSVKIRWTLLGAILLSVLLTGYIMSTPWGQARASQTSIFGEISGVRIRNQQLIYGIKGDQTILARILHNKPLGFGKEFMRQYLKYLDPGYLLLDGWSHKFFVPEQGMIYFTYTIMLIVASIIVIRVFSRRTDLRPLALYIGLLLFSLVPASLTVVESPNTNRSMLFAVVLMVAVGYGMWHMVKSHRVVLMATVTALLLESAYFAAMYTLHFDKANSIYRQDAIKELITSLSQYSGRRILMPVESTMPVYYLFYTKQMSLRSDEIFQHEAKIDHIGDIYFYPRANCLTSVEDFDSLPNFQMNDIVVQYYTCGARDTIVVPATLATLKLDRTIKGVDELLGYYIYRGEDR